MIREANQPGSHHSIELTEAMSDLAGAIRDGREWMDYKEAAAFLSLSERVFKQLSARGEIPRHRFTVSKTGGYRYHAAELTEWGLSR